MTNKGLHEVARWRKDNAFLRTSSSAVEQPVYTGSVGGSIPSSCTTSPLVAGRRGFSVIQFAVEALLEISIITWGRIGFAMFSAAAEPICPVRPIPYESKLTPYRFYGAKSEASGKPSAPADAEPTVDVLAVVFREGGSSIGTAVG